MTGEDPTFLDALDACRTLSELQGVLAEHPHRRVVSAQEIYRRLTGSESAYTTPSEAYFSV